MRRRVEPPGAGRAPASHRGDRARPDRARRSPGAGPDREPDGKRSTRAAFTALAVSVLSVAVALAAILLSLARPPEAATPPPAPLLPATVTVTLLAPR